MWKMDKKWSEDPTKAPKPVVDDARERILRRQGDVVMFRAAEEYGVRDLVTGDELCDRTRNIQIVQEHFEHTWRRRNAGHKTPGFQ